MNKPWQWALAIISGGLGLFGCLRYSPPATVMLDNQVGPTYGVDCVAGFLLGLAAWALLQAKGSFGARGWRCWRSLAIGIYVWALAGVLLAAWQTHVRARHMRDELQNLKSIR